MLPKNIDDLFDLNNKHVSKKNNKKYFIFLGVVTCISFLSYYNIDAIKQNINYTQIKNNYQETTNYIADYFKTPAIKPDPNILLNPTNKIISDMIDSSKFNIPNNISQNDLFPYISEIQLNKNNLFNALFFNSYNSINDGLSHINERSLKQQTIQLINCNTSEPQRFTHATYLIEQNSLISIEKMFSQQIEHFSYTTRQMNELKLNKDEMVKFLIKKLTPNELAAIELYAYHIGEAKFLTDKKLIQDIFFYINKDISANDFIKHFKINKNHKLTENLQSMFLGVEIFDSLLHSSKSKNDTKNIKP